MATRHTQLGDFLRSRRETLNARDLGFTSERRRRTPGLRREEVAELAGIGIDWYIRLEQGRTVSPSVATIDALARALRLGKAEHAHLRNLARDPERRTFARETVPVELKRMIASLPQPAYLTGRRWDLLAWNAAAESLFPDFARLPEDRRNILQYVLTNPGAKRLFGDGWAQEARRMLAQFRATYDLWTGDPSFDALLVQLRRDCPELRNWWGAHEVRATRSGVKLLHYGTGKRRSAVLYEYTSFQWNDDPALKLAIYVAVQADTAALA